MGKMCSTGLRQAVKPASPKDAAIIFRIVRREFPSVIGSSIAAASEGNSRFIQSRNSGLLDSWSRLRQYLGPLRPLASGPVGALVLILTKLIDDTPNNS